MYKRQALNYITIVLAISTIGMAIYNIRTKENIIWCVCFLCLTLVVNYISNKENEKDIEIKKEDKEFLNEIFKSKKK